MEPQQQYAQAQEYSAPVKMVDFGESPAYSGAPFSPSKVFLFTGLFMISMLVMIPIWNSIALLQDATFVYLSGSHLPSLVILACISVGVMYALTIVVFFQTSRPEVQTEQTILMIGSMFLALLGVLLLLLSTPLEMSAENGYHSIWDNCQFGGPTRGLYDASQSLQTLRASPSCSGLQSVEECAGFATSPAATVLKAMESDFKCTGFCFQPLAAPLGNSSATEGAAEEASMMQTQSQRTVRRGGAAAVAEAQTRRIRQVPDSLPPASFLPYPPTLFSQANFQASCDGMAARNMRNFAGDVAAQTFYEGVMLVVVSIIIGFLKLLGFCGRGREEPQFYPKQAQSVNQGYGTVPSMRQRHIARSELGLQ